MELVQQLNEMYRVILSTFRSQ